MTVRILHNPRCSKSRATLALLRERGIEPEISLYLESPPSARELKSILLKLGLQARQLLRTGETAYSELNLDRKDCSENQLIAAMSAHPELIQRPIVLAGKRAAVGRPPESVLDII